MTARYRTNGGQKSDEQTTQAGQAELMLISEQTEERERTSSATFVGP